VALGFEVYHEPETCAGVVLGPGLAYDCHGRALISARTLCLDLPPWPQDNQAEALWFDLVIRYRPDEAFQPEQRLGIPCPKNGFERMEERPDWRWWPAGIATAEAPPPALAPGIRLGEDIPLARARVTAAHRVDCLDYLIRRNAQGLVRPYLAGDQVTVLGTTSNDNPFTWSATVNTSAAGFSRVPFYFANLAEYPCPNLIAENPETLELLRHILGPFVSIQAPSAHNFTLEVHFGVSDTVSLPELETLLARCPPVLKVNWLGIEPVSGCPPPPRLNYVRFGSESEAAFQWG
jgi:hypothetical protein